MLDSTTGETWRFSVNQHDGTITRGRAYQLPSDWTHDAWQHYWDGDGQVAFIDGGYRDGTYAVTENEDTERAITAYRWSGAEALDRLAGRITAEQGATASTGSKFIVIHLDRGMDCYALSWGGDEDNAWRDEIEAVWNGDIWRIEVQEYQPGFGVGGGDWVDTDDVPEEYYGEDQAQAGFAREFDLDEFPAELLVEATS